MAMTTKTYAPTELLTLSSEFTERLCCRSSTPGGTEVVLTEDDLSTCTPSFESARAACDPLFAKVSVVFDSQWGRFAPVVEAAA